MSRFTTIIWDLDGTLLYSLEDLKNAVNAARASLGYPECDLEFTRRAIGNGVKKLVERSVPGGLSNPDYDKAYTVFNEFYMEHNLDNTRPYDGINECLKIFKEAGIKQAIVSNKNDCAVNKLNGKFFNMDFAMGVREGFRCKPDSDMVLEAMRRLSSDTDKTVYIGDSEVDIVTAKNAGLPCITVLWGFRTKEELLPFKPQMIAENTDELIKLILGE